MGLAHLGRRVTLVHFLIRSVPEIRGRGKLRQGFAPRLSLKLHQVAFSVQLRQEGEISGYEG